MRAGSGTSTCKGEAAERVGSGNVCVCVKVGAGKCERIRLES